MLSGCGETKTLLKGNKLYRYKNNQSERNAGDISLNDQLYVYTLDKPLKTKIEDKTTYYIISTTPPVTTSTKTLSIDTPVASKILLKGIVYNHENEIIKDNSSLKYLDLKFALQTLSIPLKFRKALDDGTKYPSQVETAVNFGFAPAIKLNYNFFNPTKKVIGKALNSYGINAGLLFNLGAVELNQKLSAPLIKSDRKSAVFSYGGFLMLGINNINFGFAVGRDRVFGENGPLWVYQNKWWQGVVIALDIIK